MKALALLLALVAGPAFASTSSTIVTKTSIFHPDGKPTVTFKTSAELGAAHDQCIAAAKATLGKATCTDVFDIVTTGTCVDEPKPDVPTKVVNGFLEKPALRVPVDAAGNWLPTEMEGWVMGPGYPNCWVMGWVPFVPEIEPDHGTVNEPTGRPPTP